MLNVQTLSRRYGEYVAVANASFSIEQGEIVGLLGHNGAGKTTIMKMLSGYLEPSSGSIIIDNVDIKDSPNKIQSQLGYLPENLPVYPEMNVADYLDYAAQMKGLSGEQKTREIRQAVEATEIGEKIYAPIATLSRGFKQRVGVSQAILGKPSLLILDEPTNGLDPEQTQHMRDLIRRISQEATVILSTHIMQEVDALCDRVLILRAGELVIDEKLEVLQQSNEIELSSSCSESELNSLVDKFDAIKNCAEISRNSHNNHSIINYRLRLKDACDHRQICADISKQLIEQGHSLFQMSTRTRDLESVFREVNAINNTEGQSHVA